MKPVLKLIACLLLMNFIVHSGFGQNSAGIQDETLNAEKKAFLTKQVGITFEEGQFFWPVYNEYLDKKNLLQDEKNKITVFYKYNSKAMTANDIDVTMNKYIKIVKAESFLEEIYNKRFKKVLPTVKVMKIYVAQTDFNNLKSVGSKPKVLTIQ